MYKKNTKCSRCKHYNNEQYRCDAFCSFMKETCDDVYQFGFQAGVEDTQMRIDTLRKEERTKVFDLVEKKLYENGFIFTKHSEHVWFTIRDEIEKDN